MMNGAKIKKWQTGENRKWKKLFRKLKHKAAWKKSESVKLFIVAIFVNNRFMIVSAEAAAK